MYHLLLTWFTVFNPQIHAASCKLERQLGQPRVAVTASEGESGLPVWRATWWKVLIMGDRAGALYNHSVAQNRNQFVCRQTHFAAIRLIKWLTEVDFKPCKPFIRKKNKLCITAVANRKRRSWWCFAPKTLSCEGWLILICIKSCWVGEKYPLAVFFSNIYCQWFYCYFAISLHLLILFAKG